MSQAQSIDPNWVMAIAAVLGILGALAMLWWRTAQWSAGMDAMKAKLAEFGAALAKLSELSESTSREVAELRGRMNERLGGRR